MRETRYRTSWLVLSTLGFVFAQVAHTQQPLVLYDDFSSKFIDPDRWIGQEFGFDARDVAREIEGHRLRLLNRTWGVAGTSSGVRSGGSRIRFPQPSGITTIQAEFRIKRIEVSGCATNASRSSVRGNVAGFFFNDGTPVPGSHAGDVTAQLAISRRSDSIDPEGTLRVEGIVFRCDNAACSSTTFIGSALLGTNQVREKARVQLEWDADGDRFLFQLDDNPEIAVSYTAADAAPPGSDSKIIDVTNIAANCATGHRPVAHMELLLDDVFVNQQP